MSGYQKCEATLAYCFGLTLVRQFGDIVIVMQAHNRCYEPDMVILKVGLLHCEFDKLAVNRLSQASCSRQILKSFACLFKGM